MDGAQLWQTLILAVVQGIAEFLPISSSGHLVIFGDLLDQAFGTVSSSTAKMQINVALHVGTLFSIVVVYWRELLSILPQPKLLVAVILGTIPAGVIGVTFHDFFEAAFSTPLIAGLCLYVTAAFLLLGQRLELNLIDLENIPAKHAVAIGFFQAVAILPGVSRSGSTIAGGLMTGLTRQAAATFSFLMAVPVIGGAALLEGRKLFSGHEAGYSPSVLAFGAFVAFVVGVFSLRLLIRILSQRKLHWFAYYCLLVATGTTVWQLWLRMPSGG